MSINHDDQTNPPDLCNDNACVSKLDDDSDHQIGVDCQTKGTYLAKLIDDIGFNAMTVLTCVITSLTLFSMGGDEFFTTFNFFDISNLNEIQFSIFTLVLAAFNVVRSLGSFISSYLSSKFGRVEVIQVSMLCYFILFSVVSIFNNFWVLCFIRLVISLFEGMIVALSQILVMEFLPTKKRGLIYSIVIGLYNVGYFYAALLNLIFSKENLRVKFQYVNLFLRVPQIPLILLLIFARNSLYSLFLHNNDKEGTLLLKRMTKNTQIQITNEMIQRIKAEVHAHKQTESGTSIKKIFSKQYLRLTLISMLSFMLIYIIVDSTLLVPITLMQWEDKVLKICEDKQSLIFSAILLPAGLVSGMFSSIKGIGRKGAMVISSLIILLCLILILIYPYIFVVEIGLVIFVGNVHASLLLLFITEAYPCHLRDKAVGFAFTLVGIAMSLSPIIIGLLSNPIEASYYFFIVITVILLILGVLLPFDTRNKKLEL